MKLDNLKYLAQTGKVEDLVGLLKEFGDKKTTNGGQCIDWIISGVANSSSLTEREQKKSLIADYFGKQGVFEEDGAMTPDAAKQMQETLIQLLETVQELTQEVQGLRGEVKDLKKTAEEKPATPPRPFPSVH